MVTFHLLVARASAMTLAMSTTYWYIAFHLQTHSPCLHAGVPTAVNMIVCLWRLQERRRVCAYA
eukprot:6184176-Pleurochrysis_carterae.AAC.4